MLRIHKQEMRQKRAQTLLRERNFRGAIDLIVPMLESPILEELIWGYWGLAEVCKYMGYLRQAVAWAALSAALARKNEITLLHAHSLGSRAESLLRGNRIFDAYEVASFNLALLPAGNDHRSRIMCLQGLCLSRMGTEVGNAAEMAYRLAARMAGEQARGFALSGLALLGASNDVFALIEESAEALNGGSGMIGFRLAVAQARWAVRESRSPAAALTHADALLPPRFYGERIWLHLWAESLGHPLVSRQESLPILQLPTPQHATSWKSVSPMEWLEEDNTLPDQGHRLETWLVGDAERLWEQRQRFLL